MKQRYAWAGWGDVNAFFGLMLDNVAVMVLLVGLLCSDTPPQEQKGYFTFTRAFVLAHLIPGTALGVLLGDLVYTWMAFRLARRTGKTDVTAMPLGLDTPSTFGVALLVLAPTLQERIAALLQRDGGTPYSAAMHQDAMLFAWHVGLVVLVLVGVFKVLFAPLGNAVRRWVPRAGLLGSLAAVALVLIAFLPLLGEIAAVPLVGMLALTVILVTLVAHRALPGHFPGALAAVLLGLGVYYACSGLQGVLGVPLVPPPAAPSAHSWTPLALVPDLGRGWDWWTEILRTALGKLPVMLPFGLATIVGGIDCTESAAAAGDEYDTRTILLTEGVASVAAGLLGGVIQTTPYIGHPAYKAMGGRAAYTLATALFVGAAGLFGWFTHLFEWLPQPALFPILVFVGLEITAQSFRATPARHYPALALAALPALAYLVLSQVNTVLAGKTPPGGDRAVLMVQTLRCLANGFIVTSLLWAASLAALLDGKYVRSAIYLVVCAVCALFGIIHCPLADQAIDLPGRLLAAVPADFKTAVQYQTPYHWAATYLLAAGLLLLLSLLPGRQARPGEQPAA
jgi:AGZA family xanthine/uracil permease-like MFS transporter